MSSRYAVRDLQYNRIEISHIDFSPTGVDRCFAMLSMTAPRVNRHIVTKNKFEYKTHIMAKMSGRDRSVLYTHVKKLFKFMSLKFL